ncbi:MAG: 1-acyl-sn-glycerol-3-phosphate acyltransferase [Chitinophagaceae bacterium]|nr:1-acyl-sn-glycerol-3-phosphate acyltransferase [Chitinophagaceae bacterium]
MLYRLLKIAARLALPIFCRKVVINKPEVLHSAGPLLLASNHPNSFLDSVILDTLFEKPVWSLARGDAFRKSWHARLLKRLYILPVYRTSEGVENLTENYKTFEECITLFRQNSIITIFSEGKCINEWHLRPLKKGTARLAIRAWEEGIPLKVIPVGINYSSFTRFGKNIFLNFGEPITATDINLAEPEGVRNLAFNAKLEEQLKQLVYEIPKNATAGQRKILFIPVPAWKKILLLVPAAIGWLTHLPLYLPVKSFVWKRTRHNDHYDSIMTGVLLLSYPFYLLLITVLAAGFTGCGWYLLLPVGIPFTAWAFVKIKKQ